MHRRLACFLSLTILAACAHGAPSAFVPNTNQSPYSLQRNAAADGTLIVTVLVPSTSPGFTSPSTKSVVFAVYNHNGKKLLAKKVADIGAKAHGCSSAGTVFSCVILLTVPAGKDLFNVTAFDKAKGKGRALASLLKFPHKVAKGKTSLIGFALGGIATSIDVEPVTSGVTGTAAGFTIYGNDAQTISIVTKDADRNVIMGPKAPQVKVVSVPTGATVATPSPGTVILTSTYNPTDPTVPASTSIKLQTLPVAHTGGKALSVTVPIAMLEPRIYVADYSAGKILAFDQDGNAKSLSPGAFALASAGYMAYSPSNKMIYASAYGGSTFVAFNLSGTAQTLSGSPSVSYAGQLTVDTKNNLIYMPNYGSGSSGLVTVYDLHGTQQTTASGAFSGMAGGAWLMSYDPVHDRLYGFNYGQSSGGAWNAAGALVSTGSFSGMSGSYGLAVDTRNGQIYCGNAAIPVVYDQEGSPIAVSGSWTGIPAYPTLAYDPYNDTLYAGAYPGGASTIFQYDPDGNRQTLKAGAFGGLVQPMGVLVVP